MSTGDLKNNLRKLQRLLKRIRFKAEVDYDGLSRGLPTAFLPIYHYTFTSYSRHVLSKLNEIDVHLVGTNDMRFVELMYKTLRDVFDYKPAVPKDKFFSAGFAERKVIMCTDIIESVIKLHQDLEPRKPKLLKKPTENTLMLEKDRTFSDLVSKPLDSNQAEVGISQVPKKTRPSTAPSVEGKSKSETLHLKQRPTACYTPSLYTAPRLASSAASQVKKPRVVTVDVETSDTSDRPQVEVIRMTDEDRREVLEHQRRPRDLVSHTPIHPSVSTDASVGTITRKLERLMERMLCLDERLASVEETLSVQTGERPAQAEGQERPLSAGQVENILARLTLVESRVKTLESKKSGARTVRIVDGPTAEQWMNGAEKPTVPAPTPNACMPGPDALLTSGTHGISDMLFTDHVTNGNHLPLDTLNDIESNEPDDDHREPGPSHLSPINPVMEAKKDPHPVVSDLISQVVRENGSESSEASPRISTPTEEGNPQVSFVFKSLSNEVLREQAKRIQSMVTATDEQLRNKP